MHKSRTFILGLLYNDYISFLNLCLKYSIQTVNGQFIIFSPSLHSSEPSTPSSAGATDKPTFTLPPDPRPPDPRPPDPQPSPSDLRPLPHESQTSSLSLIDKRKTYNTLITHNTYNTLIQLFKYALYSVLKMYA